MKMKSIFPHPPKNNGLTNPLTNGKKARKLKGQYVKTLSESGLKMPRSPLG